MNYPSLICRVLSILLVAGLLTGCSKNTAENQATAQKRMKGLGVALLMYTSDYEGFYPVATDAEQVKARLSPYFPPGKTREEGDAYRKEIFTSPISGEMIQFNMALSGRPVRDSNFQAVNAVAFYESNAKWGKDERYVTMTSGQVQRVSEAAWGKLKADSGIK